MKTQQHIDALYERRKTAGGFEQALIDAYLRADGGNTRILEEAFKGTRFDLTPKPKYNHGVETLRNAAYWSGHRDEYLNDDKTAYQIIDEYLKMIKATRFDNGYRSHWSQSLGGMGGAQGLQRRSPYGKFYRIHRAQDGYIRRTTNNEKYSMGLYVREVRRGTGDDSRTGIRDDHRGTGIRK